MSKVFKANESTSDARVIKVGPWAKPGVELMVELGDRWGKGIVIPPEDAPALALAVLESAQGDPAAMDADIAEAMQKLRKYVYAREEAAKEAADREALEIEAETLFMARMKSHLEPLTFKPFSEQPDRYRGEWVKVAIAAREIHKAKS